MPKPKPAKRPPADQVACAALECSNTFTPKRSTARYCGTTCRQRAARARRAAAAAEEADRRAETEPGEGGAEHGLVKATRLELEKAEAVDTVDGQLALQMARKLADPEVSGFAGLASTLRVVLAAATGAKAPTLPGEGAPDPSDDDEVAAARRARDEAREAAGLA